MDTFFTYLKKSLVATIFIVFGFVAVYTPQNWHNVPTAEAKVIPSTLPLQILGLFEQAGTFIQTTISAGYNAITSWATNYLALKDGALDGLAWFLAKSMISAMLQSLISWINSGFKGRPAFVDDLSDFLLNAADNAVGTYIKTLGDVGSFICGPFQLDVQLAVATEYQLGRINQPAADCSLSGIAGNLDDFTSGAPGSFSQGGWNDWLTITSNPGVYTKYGSVLKAKIGAKTVEIDTKNEESSILNFGDGFLSEKYCEAITGSTEQSCTISKPGKILQEALTFNLDSGRQSLVAADEVDEVFVALMGQLAKSAISGTKGLLGLDGGSTSYKPYTNPYFGNISTTTATSSPISTALASMNNDLVIQKTYLQAAIVFQTNLTSLAAKTSSSTAKQAAKRDLLTAEVNKITPLISTLNKNVSKLDKIITEFSKPTTTSVRKAQLTTQYNNLKSSAPLFTQTQQDSAIANWVNILSS